MRLILHGIICEKTQEAIDEVFLSLTWGGHGPFPPAEWTWGPRSMNDGDARKIGYSQDVGQSFTIVAIEWDRRSSNEVGRFGRRDSNPMGRFEQVLEGRGARYRIIYSVAPTNDMGTGCVLRLHRIHCNDAQERKDEPYLAVNGATIWGPASMRTGEDQNIDKEVDFSQGETVRIDLWEHDPALSERFGGPLIVDATSAAPPDESPPWQPHVFRSDRGITGDATYTLYYTVRQAR